MIGSDNVISGTLHYVTGYTGFHGTDPTEQEGTYLALGFEKNGAEGTLSTNLIGGDKGNVAVPWREPICVYKIDDTSQTIKVSCGLDYNETFTLTGLVLEEEE